MHERGGVSWARWRVLLLIGALLWAGRLSAQDLDFELLDAPVEADAAAAPTQLDSFLDEAGGGTRFVLVSVDGPHEPVEQLGYWRTFEGAVTAAVGPARFELDGRELIGPRTVQNPQTQELERHYPAQAKASLAAGKHSLTPGPIELTWNSGQLTSSAPALKQAGADQIHILCAPVRFEAIDPSGAAEPFTFVASCGDLPLMRSDEGQMQYRSLVLYLPIGLEYQTSFGSFRVGATGRVEPIGKLAEGVELIELRTLRRNVPQQARLGRSTIEPVRVLAREGQASAFDLWAWPVVDAERRVWMALVKSSCERALREAFDPQRFTFAITVDGASLQLGSVRAEASPSDAMVRAAAQGLNSDAASLTWLNVQLPADAQGVAGLVLQHERAEPTRLNVYAGAPAGRLTLIPHRGRRVFAADEELALHVYGPTPWLDQARTVELQVQVEGRAEATVLNTFTLAAVDAPASRTHQGYVLKIKPGVLPPGQHVLRLAAEDGASAELKVQVVPWEIRSSFLVQTASVCTTPWPADDQGLQLLFDAGIDMAMATGHRSLLDAGMPTQDAALAAQVAATASDLPPEALWQRSANDELLERMLRHQVRSIDLTVAREHAFYNEGLSYHHSYGPSVERMLRRMQIFTQQTADYPSFWGVNYAWFPVLQGYVEGGVPTDAHTVDRNRVLAQRVEQAGAKPLSHDELQWYLEHYRANAAEDRARLAELRRQAVTHWKTQQQLGWAEHNALYNQAVRAVRPQTVATLFENAGHDAGKRTSDLFNDMAAVTYETYTDYGDWPMSTGFSTDWAEGNSPGQPVWITTSWGASVESSVRSLMHGFARGLAGGGVPMQADADRSTLERRAQLLRWVSQYGPIATHAVPDARVAILMTDARLALEGRSQYSYHAAYYHLTRLGAPPALVAETQVMAEGVPTATKLLVLVHEAHGFEPALTAAIERFVERGGRVLVIGPCAHTFANAIVLGESMSHLWDLSGFHPEAHEEMWRQFVTHWREPLENAIEQAGLARAAVVDPEWGYALTQDAPGIRYVTVLADRALTHANVFEPIEKLGVDLEGEGWLVRDVTRQQNLPASSANGRSQVAVDLVTEPAAVLALYRSAPAQVKVRSWPTQVQLGQKLWLACEVTDADGQVMANLPVTWTLLTPDGRERAQLHRASGDAQRMQLAQLDQAGAWRVRVQEQITGQTTEVALEVAAAPSAGAVELAGDVHEVEPRHVELFLQRKGRKLVVVEEHQQKLRALAQQLVEGLRRAGQDVELMLLGPEHFDTHPVRWYPQPLDQARLELIEQGRLIGFHENLRSYINPRQRVHVPERGGYARIAPHYMMGRDVILLGSGRLSQSLAAVTSWAMTPSSPRTGAARLVVAFSAFGGDRHALAILSHDAAGLRKGVEHLTARAAGLSAHAGEATQANAVALTPPTDGWQVHASTTERREVPTPLRNVAPLRRVRSLLVNANGHAAVQLRSRQDTLALVDEQGNITATLDPGPGQLQRIDDVGQAWRLVQTAARKQAGSGAMTWAAYALEAIGSEGRVVRVVKAYEGPLGPPGFEAGFMSAPDGRALTLGRQGGALLYEENSGSWRFFDDRPWLRERFEALYPRMPVAAIFSPDSKWVLLSMDTRPPLSAMGSPQQTPTAAQALLVEVATGEVRWSLRDEDYTRPRFAVRPRLAAVSAGGVRTAMIDAEGTAFLVGEKGELLFTSEAEPAAEGAAGRAAAVGVGIDAAGALAMFAWQDRVMLVHDSQAVEMALPAVAAAAVAADASVVGVGLEDGQVIALEPDGRERWRQHVEGVGPQVAALAGGHLLVASSAGQLMRFDRAGQVLWRTDVAARADQQRHVPEAADMPAMLPPAGYREPGTIKIARQRLGATEAARWSAPEGMPTQRVAGRDFYKVEQLVGLAAQRAQAGDEFLLELVYRLGAAGQDRKQVASANVTLTDEEGERTFVLDLPTPEYRVVALPMRGAQVRVKLAPTGELWLARAAVYRFGWPGANLAFVQQASAQAAAGLGAGGGGALEGFDDELMGDLADAGGGRMKDAKILWPNTDPDRVGGQWVRPAVDPLRMVDGRRFSSELSPWADRHRQFAPFWGGLFTLDFGRPTPLQLVATYDRATRQSQVAQRIAIFSGQTDSFYAGTKLLTSAIENDQFFRLFELPEQPVQVLGVHALAPAGLPTGLSEIEAYQWQWR